MIDISCKYDTEKICYKTHYLWGPDWGSINCPYFMYIPLSGEIMCHKDKEVVSDINKPHNIRGNILSKAYRAVCTDREQQYGSPEDNFKLIAQFWSDYLGHDIQAEDVAMMMCLLKIVRIKTGKYKEDNFIDLSGYAACAAEVSNA